MTTPTKIMVIGRVSSGKSSFINSLTGAFISCVSLNRETFNPILYTLRKNGNQKNAWEICKELYKKHESNEKERKSLSSNISNTKQLDQIETKYTNIDKSMTNVSLPNVFDYDIDLYDFPGIADAEDNHNIFEKAIENLISIMDIVLFVVDATRAFVHKEELEEFNKVKKLVENNATNHSQYTWLGVIVNKYDDVDDEEITEIYDKIKDKISCENIYRYSSHRVFTERIFKYGVPVPQFMLKEFKKILDHGSVIITEELSEKLISDKKKNNNYYYFGSEEFKYSKKIQEAKNKYKLFGDWDNLVESINNIIKHNDVHREEVLLNSIKENIKKIPNERISLFKCKYSDFKIDGCNSAVHNTLTCGLHYIKFNNRSLYKTDKGNGCYYKCQMTGFLFNCEAEHKNCYENFKDKKCEHVTKTIKETIDKILSKKLMLKEHNISLDKYHNAIINYIAKAENLYAIYLLYETEKELYLKTIVTVAFNEIYKYFPTFSNNTYDDVLLFYKPEITKHFNEQQVKSLLSLEQIWQKNFTCNEKFEVSSNNTHSWPLAILYPSFKKLILIAQADLKSLHILYHNSTFDNLGIYKNRIKLFIDRNIVIKDNDHRSMNQKLFDDSFLSEKEYDGIMVMKNELDKL